MRIGNMVNTALRRDRADTSSHGRVRFVISLTSNDDQMMRFRLLRAIESGL
jgi:serine-type D-Ala-D-Ala carboxypeptidase/endopeptidase (penicillin-binding protein 4)